MFKNGNGGAIVEVEPPSAAFANRRPKAGSLWGPRADYGGFLHNPLLPS
ncbi:hypothetical protein K5I04_04375 [Murdochiella sp. Marseille-P8839]|nr:hypothetical protein [Murdochiella sp. Marseille-P8839]